MAAAGNWVFREQENHSSVYRTTSINTSKDMMSYADFPMPEHLAPFPERDELCEYGLVLEQSKGFIIQIS